LPILRGRDVWYVNHILIFVSMGKEVILMSEVFSLLLADGVDFFFCNDATKSLIYDIAPNRWSKMLIYAKCLHILNAERRFSFEMTKWWKILVTPCDWNINNSRQKKKNV
jgi:hypothetical protein